MYNVNNVTAVSSTVSKNNSGIRLKSKWKKGWRKIFAFIFLAVVLAVYTLLKNIKIFMLNENDNVTNVFSYIIWVFLIASGVLLSYSIFHWSLYIFCSIYGYPVG